MVAKAVRTKKERDKKIQIDEEATMKYVKFFLVFIAVVSMTGCVTLPPLMDAADKGDINAVNALLDKGADVNEWRYGTALMLASYRENTDMVKLLIDRGADVNAMNKGGHSALGIAAEWGNADIVEILIAKGADIDKAIVGMEQRAITVAVYPDIVAKVKRGINLITNKAGWVYYHNGQHQKAINAFKKAISSDPSISSNFSGLSASYRALKQYDEAITVTKRVIELNPQDAVAYNNLGWAYVGKEQYDEAFKALKKAIELDPKDAAYYSNLGWCLLLKRDYKESATYLKKAVELAPDNEVYLSALYIAYYLQDSYEDALDTVNKFIDLSSFVGFGTQIQIMSNFPVVKEVYKSSPAKAANIQPGDKIIKVDRESTENWDIKKVVQKLRGQEGAQVTLMIKRKDIKEPFEKTVTRQKIFLKRAASLFGFRSLIQRHRGKPEGALKDAEQAYSLDSSDKWAKKSLGATYLDQGKYAEAIKLLSTVKDSIIARVLEATAYAKQGDFQKAIDIYSAIPEEKLSRSDRAALLAALTPYVASKQKSAGTLRAQGEYKEALGTLGEAMKLVDDAELEEICREIAGIMAINPGLSAIPEEARKYALRGDVLTEEGKFEDAVKEYRQAVQAAPYIAKLYLSTAMIYGELKRYPQAVRYMKTYLGLAPEAPNARAAKDQIYKWEFKMEKGG